MQPGDRLAPVVRRFVAEVTPVTDPRIRDQLLDVLDRCLADNTNAWVLQGDGTWIRRRPDGEAHNVQRELMDLHEARAAGEPAR